MLCQACTAEIPNNCRFCPHCGAPVANAGSTLASSADRIELIKEYVPPELASKILQVGKKIENERRHVTVIFADVTGFTALAEQIDPEIMSSLLNDCFKGLVNIVYKYEGTVDKFIGDTIMIIFGAPLAHKNCPERAIRCALEMMEDIKRFNVVSQINITTPINLHIGIHSGIIVAGNVGSDLRMNYSVVGDTVNLASRLAHLAPPGEIFMSKSAYKLSSQLVVANGPYSLSVRGKSEPVMVYKLQEVKHTFGHDKQRPAAKFFVGREKELQVIAKMLDLTKQKKKMRLFVKGEAGVGKSHLKDEVYKLAIQKSISPVEGLCSSFEINTPYFLWNTLLRSILQIDFDTPEFEVKNHLQRRLDSLSMRKDVPYILAILGIRHDRLLVEEGSERKQKIFKSFTKLLKNYVNRHRTVIILEDLHWIDKFSQELLYFILSQGEPVKTLIIGFYRPEYTHAKSVESAGHVINLKRLSKDDSKKLMKLHLGTEKIPSQVQDIILGRSEGNPFYIQEIIKAMLDKNIILIDQREVRILKRDFDSEIPGTIQGIIMSRIDSVQESIKSVLFSAAVIGREFSRPILERVIEVDPELDKKLNELKSLELILEKEEAREFDYIFKHYLIQEAAYSTIFINKRKELHASIAHAIESLYQDRLQEFYEILAFHYEKAENWEKAAEYLGRSGNKVKQIYSKAESEDFFKRKDVALQKIYEAKSTQGSLLETLRNILPPLIAMLIPLLPIYGYVLLLGKNLQTAFIETIVIVVIASLLCIWYAVTLWFLGVVPFLRGQPKLYDLLENQVRVIFRDGSKLSVEFSEIAKVRFLNSKIRKSRSFIKRIIDPFCRVATNQKLTFTSWLREVFFNVIPPYSFGLGSKKGEILIQRRTGYRLFRILIPWFNSPQKSKDLSLFPYAPWEFFEQFRVAFYSWKRQINV